MILAPALMVLARERRRLRDVRVTLVRAEGRRGEVVRLVRMAASDLRGPALGLLGHAERAPAELRPSLIGTCRYLLDLAEALIDQTEEPGTPRTLRAETVQVRPLVDFVISQVAAQLGPGRRVWRLRDGLDGATVLADRRALHQVLLRVVTGAALCTGDGDWIEISAAARGEHWVLAVEDEGTGLAISKTAGGVETRGLGVGLALARRLMQAHGGELTIESTAKVGTRALISLPVSRLLPQA